MTDIYCRFHESDLLKLTELNLSRSEIIIYLHFKVSSMSDKFQKIIKCTRKDLEDRLKLSKATVNRALKKLSRLGLITLNEVKEKVIKIVSSQEVLREDLQQKVDEECTTENHAALELPNNEYLNDLSATSIKVSSDDTGACDGSDDIAECNQSAVVEDIASPPVPITKPVKKEKPRIPERLIVPKLKQKFNCECHPFDVLKSITNCFVYSDQKSNCLCFQSKVTDDILYKIDIKQFINSLPDDCDSQAIKDCLELINIVTNVKTR